MTLTSLTLPVTFIFSTWPFILGAICCTSFFLLQTFRKNSNPHRQKAAWPAEETDLNVEKPWASDAVSEQTMVDWVRGWQKRDDEALGFKEE